MKKIAVLLALMLVSFAAHCQTKDELKAARKAQRAEQRRIRDSIYYAQDSIWRAEQAAYDENIAEERAKKGSTALLVYTSYDTTKQALDVLVSSLLANGFTPASIDKEYNIIKTEPKQVGSATYTTTYTIYQHHEGKVCVRATSIARGNIIVGSGLFHSNTEMIVPVEYGGVKGSLTHTAWIEMEAFLLSLPHTNVEYIKQ